MTATTPRTDPTVIALLGALKEAGVRVSANGANLRYSSAAPIPSALLRQLAEHKAAVLAYLASWDNRRALALQEEADGLVAASGVSGRDPVIAEVAARCVEAHAKQDMAGVRVACHAIEDRARKLASAAKQEPAK